MSSKRFGAKVAGAITKRVCSLAIFAAIWMPLAVAQNQGEEASAKESGPVAKSVDYLFNYLNMAGTKKSSEFKPLTQRERTHLYYKTVSYTHLTLPTIYSV